MKIIADSNILAVQSHFAEIADVQLLPGRAITRSDLLQADALLVRSITRVDENLLRDTPIKFVGTATSGTDHIDLSYLQSRNIHFAAAAGSNANAVVEYCFAALAFAVRQRKLDINRCRVGLIGAGHVGGLLAQKLRKLDISCFIYDPPLAQRIETAATNSVLDLSRQWGFPVSPRDGFCSLEEVLQCNVVSLHVPLIATGQFATRGLIAAQELAQLPSHALLINTCRGEVAVESGLLQMLGHRHNISYVADVWSNEPDVSAELVSSADVATPHIAGYSLDAKLGATQKLLGALTGFFGISSAASAELQPESEPVAVKLDNTPDAHWDVLLKLFPLLSLSEEFKYSSRQDNAAVQFDAMRKRLLKRREFSHCKLTGNPNPEQRVFLQTLGIACD